MPLGPQLTREQIAAISSLYVAGKSNKDISVQTGITLRTVQRWTKKCKAAGGADPPLQLKRSGRARKTSKRTLKVIQRQLDAESRITAKELKEKNPQLLQQVSVRTIQRRLKNDLGYEHRVPRRKPILKLKQRKSRIQFCKKYLNWDNEKWKTVLWSDEATFNVTGNRGGKVRLRPGTDPLDPKYTQGTVKYPDSVMVWGAFGYHGQSKLVVLPKNVTVNKERYLELLCDHLEDCFETCRSTVFMLDSAPAHTAKLIKNWFEFVGVDYVKDWPGNSPDLNPIENLWRLIKRRLRGRNTATVPTLIKEIQDIWNNLEPSTLQRLAESVPRRLQSCIKRKGLPTRIYFQNFSIKEEPDEDNFVKEEPHYEDENEIKDQIDMELSSGDLVDDSRGSPTDYDANDNDDDSLLSNIPHTVKHFTKESETKEDPYADLLAERLQSKTKYNSFGSYVALRLNALPRDMAIYCQKIINDALFEAELGTLHRYSKINNPCDNLDNTSGGSMFFKVQPP